MIPNPMFESKINVIEKEVEQLSAETKKFVNNFPKSFSRKGKTKDHKIKIKTEEDTTISQQKEKQYPSKRE